MLIDAIAALNRENIILLIAGDGWYRSVLEAKVKSLGIATKVRFLGMRTDMPKIYQVADIFVLCSRYEGFGHVYLEAMASGLVCIGLKGDYPRVVVATEEIIADEKSGFCVNSNQINDLVEKLDFLIGNELARKDMGYYSRIICHRHFNWNTNVKKILKI